MRLWLLYLRSRLAFPAMAGVLLIAGLCWVVGNRWGSQPDLFLIATVIVPLAAAVVIAVTTVSPFITGSPDRAKRNADTMESTLQAVKEAAETSWPSCRAAPAPSGIQYRL